MLLKPREISWPPSAACLPAFLPARPPARLRPSGPSCQLKQARAPPDWRRPSHTASQDAPIPTRSTACRYTSTADSLRPPPALLLLTKACLRAAALVSSPSSPTAQPAACCHCIIWPDMLPRLHMSCQGHVDVSFWIRMRALFRPSACPVPQRKRKETRTLSALT